MTGFGQAESKSSFGHTRVEIKTTNHKFFEISVRLPGHLAEFEDALRKKIGSELRRGKVFVFVSSPDPAVISGRLMLNENLAREAKQKIAALAKRLGLRPLSDEAMLKAVLRQPDVLIKDVSSTRRDQTGLTLMKTAAMALKDLNASRLAEGRALEKDFRRRLAELAGALRKIEKQIPQGARQFRKSLESRMSDFIKNGDLDRERLTLEVAQYLKNADISEEVTRLKSHMEAMGKALGDNQEVGKRMDFIGQEMLRETNTMGSKSPDTVIAHAVIELKGTIEKIREQAQNIE